jgi:hypothetical protein
MTVKINPEPNVIADDLLDTIGHEWSYDHVKGQNEWWKNATDQYIRDEVPDEEQVILVDMDERKPKKDSVFRVIDFGGMDHSAITDAFKRWGDIRAAQRGTKKRTFGGHGNGGKFYMRSAFKTSRFVTYRDGRLNVYGFNEQRQYGFEEGHEDVEMSLDEALDVAGIDRDVLPGVAQSRLEASRGFTVVIGEHPNNFSGRATAARILQKLCEHAQARRLVAHRPVFARTRDGDWRRLHAHDPEPRPDFSEPLRIDVPEVLIDENGDDVVLRDEEFPDAFLQLEASRNTLRGTGANRIDVIGEIGIVGSHDITSLGLTGHPAQGDFIYGELYCPKLEDPEYKCVANDRDRLIDNEKTRALLEWARDRVDELAGKIAEADAKERQAADLSQSSQFNELLNQWKNKFMPTLMAQLFGGPGEGSGFGGLGTGAGGDGSGNGIVGRGRNESDDGRQGGDKGGGGDEIKRGRRAPTVLLSSHDADPLDLMAPPLELSPRQPAVYQRPADVNEGIYWINTSRPLAQRILDAFGAESTRWRDYMFQRYVEIILKESIHTLEQNEGGELTADRLQGHIDSLYTTVHDQAYDDLDHFLFEEKLRD